MPVCRNILWQLKVPVCQNISWRLKVANGHFILWSIICFNTFFPQLCYKWLHVDINVITSHSLSRNYAWENKVCLLHTHPWRSVVWNENQWSNTITIAQRSEAKSWYFSSKVIQSYPRKSMIVSEFESSRGTTQINQRRTRNKTEMEDATI